MDILRASPPAAGPHLLVKRFLISCPCSYTRCYLAEWLEFSAYFRTGILLYWSLTESTLFVFQNHNFMFMFMFQSPSGPRARGLPRVWVSPTATKRYLLRTLGCMALGSVDVSIRTV